MGHHDNIIMNIKPSTAIRHDYNSFSKLCHETQAPVVVTKNGEADLVVMSERAREANRLQKVLEGCNIKLGSVTTKLSR